MTLRLFSRNFESVPASTAWYFSDIEEAKGKVECLGRGQSAQRRKTKKWQLGNTQ